MKITEIVAMMNKDLAHCKRQIKRMEEDKDFGALDGQDEDRLMELYGRADVLGAYCNAFNEVV